MTAIATTGPFNASVLLLYANNVVIAHTNDYTLKLDNALIDVTTRNSAGWKETLSGVRSWSISCAGMTAYDDAAGFMALLQGPINRTVYALKLSTGLAGDYFLSGNARIASVTQTAKAESASTFTGTFDGTGALLVGNN